MISIFLIYSILTILLYIIYSKNQGSYINALTGITFFKVVIEFSLEPIAYFAGIFSYKEYLFFQIYTANFIWYLFLIFGAFEKKSNTSCIKNKTKQNKALNNYIPWLLLLVGLAIYMPILYEYRDYLGDPRYIYEQTRTGYGLMYFGSALFVNISLMTYLLSEKNNKLIYGLIFLLLILIKGSKGQLVTAGFIYLIWLVYVKQNTFSARKAAVIIISASMIFLPVFILNFRGQIDSLFLTLAGYSDYNRNASLVLEETTKFTDGKLLLEDYAYSKIPRIIWPDKPKNFGRFFLAEKFFPEWFELDQGSPSFGVGIFFADFGSIAFLVLAIFGYLNGLMLKISCRNLRNRKSIFYFVMALFFSDVTLIPVGAGYFLIEHVMLGLILVLIFERKIVFSSEKLKPPASNAQVNITR